MYYDKKYANFGITVLILCPKFDLSFEMNLSWIFNKKKLTKLDKKSQQLQYFGATQKSVYVH